MRCFEHSDHKMKNKRMVKVTPLPLTPPVFALLTEVAHRRVYLGKVESQPFVENKVFRFINQEEQLQGLMRRVNKNDAVKLLI